MKEKTCFILLVTILLMSTALIPVASAHRAFVGEVVEDQMKLKAWYEGGDPMSEAKVTVYSIENEEEKPYLEGGLTDGGGFYSFELKPGVTEYMVVVEQMGHRTKTNINLEEDVNPQENAELPLYARIVAGLGYLLGLAGIGMIYSARKMQKGR